MEAPRGRSVAANMGRGAIMGLADVVPGVSGGTMALLLGIYARFIGALAHLMDLRIVRYAFGVFHTDGRRRFLDHARETDFWFLVQLGLGIGAALLVGAHLVGTLIERYPVAMMALFFGLILVSARIPWRHIEHRRAILLVPAVLGLVVAATVALLPARSIDPGLWVLYGSGALAITAMLLPGISGSALLVLLGVYPAVLLAVQELRWASLGAFALGALTGILLASRAIRFALATRPSVTFATLTGLMVGSVVRVWPWRDEAGFGAGHPTWPDGWLPLAIMVVGGVASVLLERLGAQAGQATASGSQPQ